MQETRVWSLGQEDPLEKEIAVLSSILAWGIPWTEEPGGLQPIVSQKSQTHLGQLNSSNIPLVPYSIPVFIFTSIKWVLYSLNCTHLICAMKKAMAPHSSTLAWKIPWTEEPSALQSMGLLGVGHDWATSLSLFAFMHWRKCQPTPVFLLGESQGWGSLWAAVYGVAQSRTRLTWLSSSSSNLCNFLCTNKAV